MTARNWGLSKRLIESYTSPGCGRAFERQPRLTGALEVRKLSNAPFSFGSAEVSTAEAGAVVSQSSPSPVCATANNSIGGFPWKCFDTCKTPGDCVLDGCKKTSSCGVAENRGSKPVSNGVRALEVARRAGVTTSPHDAISSVLNMRSLPYSAVNRNRFILDIPAFQRALEGGT